MGKRRVNFQRCWLPVSRIGLHRRGVERVNCGPKLLDLGEKGVYSSYTCIGYLWLGSQLQPAQSTVPPDWAITAAYVAAPVALKILVFFMLGRPQLRYLNEEVHNA